MASTNKTFHGTISPGLLSIDNDAAPSALVSVNGGDPTKYDALGGRGIVIDRSITGKEIERVISWPATVAISTAPFTDGNFPIVVDVDSNIFLVDTDGSSKISTDQFNSLVQLGVLTLGGGNITGLTAGFWPSNSLASTMYALGIGLSVFNFPGQDGYDLLGNDGGLTMRLTPGTAFSTIAGTISNIETPSIVSRTVGVNPIPLIALADPVTGVFSISGTAELDPTKITKRGSITAFADLGGGVVRVSSNQHGIVAGNIVTIENTISYNGSFTIVANAGNTFDITATFVADDATGIWSALTATTASRFTAQRLNLFPANAIVGAFYGLVEYMTISDFDQAGGELTEGFLEPAIGTASAKIKLIIISSSMTDFVQTTLFAFRAVTSRFK